MKYEVTLIRYVPEYVCCEVEATSEAEAIRKVKKTSKLYAPSLQDESFDEQDVSFDTQVLASSSTFTITIDGKTIDIRELPPDTSRQ